MPQIRKKTSKRISTHQRAKFKHKVAEGRKKKKKEAKKNPQWKSKKKKDPGIPNNFPYKDQILAEIADTRRQAEEAKQRRKEEKKATREGLPVDGSQDVDIDVEVEMLAIGPSSKAQREEEAPLLVNPDLPNLKAVLDKADVVLHVLDARDPASHRLPHIEDLVLANEKSKLVFVLNKIDLVPRETLTAWVKQLRTQHSTFLFRSASSFLPKTMLNDPKAKGKAKETPDDSIGSEALLEYLGQWADVIQSDNLQVAVVGLTNSGKSAVVNSLARKAIVPLYLPSSSTDAWITTTTRAFEVSVEVDGRKINLVDTPGVSLQNELEPDEGLKTRDMLLRCRGRVDKVKDPVPAVEHIVSRADTHDLMVHYNLPLFTKGDATAFLTCVARSNTLIKKGGDPDLTQAARIVLREWTTGKLPFYTDAPVQESAAPVSDPLAELYGRADEVALAHVRLRSDMRKHDGLVKIVPGEVEKRSVVLDMPFVVEEVESESEGEVDEGELEGEDEEEDELQGDSGDDDEEEEDEDEADEDVPTPPLTGKRKRKAAAAAAPAPPPKKVAFTAGTRARKGKQQPSKPAKPAAKPAATAANTLKSSLKKAAPVKVTNASAKPKAAKDATEGGAYDFKEFFR